MQIIEEAFGQIKDNVWDLQEKLQKCRTLYQTMLEYLKKGVADEERPRMFRELSYELIMLYQEVNLRLEESTENNPLLQRRRKVHKEGKKQNLRRWMECLKEADERVENGLKEKTDVMADLEKRDALRNDFFEVLTVYDRWEKEDIRTMDEVLADEQISEHNLCLTVSGVTLNLLCFMDLAQVKWLIKAMGHASSKVTARAIVGLAYVMRRQHDSLLLHPELKKEMDLLCEDPTFGQYMQFVIKQSNRNMMAEEIGNSLMNDFNPQIIEGLKSKMERELNRPEQDDLDFDDEGFGFDDDEDFEQDLDEEMKSGNPDWQLRKALESHMDKLTAYIKEGMDVNFVTYKSCKRYAFYYKMSHWFAPFDELCPELVKCIGLERTGVKKGFINLVSQQMICDNDRYSIFLTLSKLSAREQNRMANLMPSEVQQAMENMGRPGFFKDFIQQEITLYLQDLYRFFKLSSFHKGYNNPFKQFFQPEDFPAFSAVLRTEEFYMQLVDFFLERKEYETADHYCEQIGLMEPMERSATWLQKWAYCCEKEEDYEEAYKLLKEAHQLNPNDVWTIQHLIYCIKNLFGDEEEVAQLYRKLLTLQPENQKFTLKLAKHQEDRGYYEEALQLYFKLYYWNSEKVEAWKGIAHCSLHMEKLEQAEKFLRMIPEEELDESDLRTWGHIELLRGEVQKAFTLYKNAFDLVKEIEQEAFVSGMERDMSTMEKLGIERETMQMITDLSCEDYE